MYISYQKLITYTNIYIFQLVEDIRRNIVEHLQRINIKTFVSDVNQIGGKS